MPVEHFHTLFGFWSPDRLSESAPAEFEAMTEHIERRLSLRFSTRSGPNLHMVGCPLPLDPKGRKERDYAASIRFEYSGTRESGCTGRMPSPAGVSLELSNNQFKISRGVAGATALYFRHSGQGVLFLSNLAYLNRLGLEIDRSAITAFLRFLYVPAPLTIYKDVSAVLPGETCRFSSADGGAIRCERFSEDVEQPETNVPPDIETALAGFEERLVYSVKAACENGKRGLLLLSGGKDSSGLAVAAANAGVQNIDAGTVSFPGSTSDEGDDARVVANHCGFHHRVFSEDSSRYIDAWPAFVKQIGQPNGDPASLPLFVFFGTLRDEYDFIIDGTGNDSYFGIVCGRRSHLIWALKRSCPWLGGPQVRGLVHKLGLGGRLPRKLLQPPEEQFVSWQGFERRELDAAGAASLVWDDLSLYRLYSACQDANEHMTRTLCNIWEPEAAYRKVVQPLDLLGPEARYPYLDTQLATHVRGLPASWRATGTINKVLLRMFLEKNLPTQITEKKKGAFVFPKAFLLDPDQNSYFRGLFSKDVVESFQLLDWSLIKDTLRRYRRGEREMESRIYGVFMLLSWLMYDRCDTSFRADRLTIWR